MHASSRIFLCVGAATLLAATAFGAYGTHALAARLPAATWAAYETAVDYQFYHGLGLCTVAILTELRPAQRLFCWAGWLLLAGIVLFCGGIYATSFGAPAMVGRVVPLGGTIFMAAWLILALGALRARRGRRDGLA